MTVRQFVLQTGIHAGKSLERLMFTDPRYKEKTELVLLAPAVGRRVLNFWYSTRARTEISPFSLVLIARDVQSITRAVEE